MFFAFLSLCLKKDKLSSAKISAYSGRRRFSYIYRTESSRHLAISILTLFTIIFQAVPAETYEYKLSSGDKTIFRNAYSRTRNNQFDSAITEASKANEKVILKLIKWAGYQDGYTNGGFPEIANFIAKNPHWPGQKILRNKAEFALTGREPASDIIKYFTDFPPVTGHGMRIFAEAKIATGNGVGDAVTLLKQSWQQGDFSQDQEESFLREHGKVLNQDDLYKRVDRFLWEGEEAAAKRLYHLLGSDHKQIVQARLQLMGNNPGAIARLPESLRNDPGLIYEQIRIQNERENFERVYQLVSPISSTMPFQAKWWKLKNRLVRELLDHNKIKEAYKIASQHGNEAGSSEYAESEWLAGWISLRFLSNPGSAYTHFDNMYNNVVSPISLSRAAYWAGRAAESNRNPDVARNWYDIASQHSTTFYGQLAYIKMNGKHAAPSLPEAPEMGILPENAGKVRELLMAAYILESAGQSAPAEKFMKAAIGSVSTASEMSYICEFGIKIGRTNLAVIAAKEALTKGVALVNHGWPKTKYMPKTIKVEDAFALAIIRQESIFNPNALSPANAMGLMQLIPPTAKRMAKSVGVAYHPNKLLSDPEYNITLGSHYLGSLVGQWDGSYILAIASYNAGPGNARKWTKKYNDPREMDNIEDIIDWIESIPFNETRNYVQRVLENVQVYRSRLGNSDLAIGDDLIRGTKIQ